MFSVKFANEVICVYLAWFITKSRNL